MTAHAQPLFSESCLRAVWAEKETSAESTFVHVFFRETWGYWANGEPGYEDDCYTSWSQFPVAGAGQTGGTGQADLALGVFGSPTTPPIPQVLCEFKDVRSGLDAPQNRKGNNRSPVKQCADYVRCARSELFGNEPIQPTWGIVTDMNEFRLYLYDRMPAHMQRFVIDPAPGDAAESLIGAGEDASFQRFVFWKVFRFESLLTRSGRSRLEKLLTRQWVQEKDLERTFYLEYQAFRKSLFEALVEANPKFLETHTKGSLVRLAQRYLDRCLFLMYCEDMGPKLCFPRDLFRDLLVRRSLEPYYAPDDTVVQVRVNQIFRAMRDGGNVLGHRINKFNGGLFAADADLDGLEIPTKVFCGPDQRASPERLLEQPKTLLYLSATYNFGVRGSGGEKVVDLCAKDVVVGLTAAGRDRGGLACMMAERAESVMGAIASGGDRVAAEQLMYGGHDEPR